jgi:flagellar assembly protein FliH
MKSLSRILKSSIIQVGAKKKLEFKIVHSVAEKKQIKEERDVEKELEILNKNKLEETEKLAKDKMHQATIQAQKIITDAHEDAEQIYEDAKKDGHDKGYLEGYAAGEKKAEELIQEALEIKNMLIQTKKELIKNVEKDCIELVIKTLEKILYQKIDDSEETIIGLIKGALEKCTYTESLVLRVSPQDYQYTFSVKDKILCLVENVDTIQIKQDASLKKGSCILDTISGSIDSSIHTQFAQVKSMFEDFLKNR